MNLRTCFASAVLVAALAASARGNNLTASRAFGEHDPNGTPDHLIDCDEDEFTVVPGPDRPHTCAELVSVHACDHKEYGFEIRRLCPKSCPGTACNTKRPCLADQTPVASATGADGNDADDDDGTGSSMQCTPALTCSGDSFNPPGRACSCAGGGTEKVIGCSSRDPSCVGYQANGCGAPPFNFDSWLVYPEETKCCHEHDHCYGTQGVTRLACDNNMFDCFNAAAEIVRKRHWFSGDARANAVLLRAFSVWSALAAAGDFEYDKEQRRRFACSC